MRGVTVASRTGRRSADWLGCENGVSPHRVKHLIVYMHDDWLPCKPATKAAYELLPEWACRMASRPAYPGI